MGKNFIQGVFTDDASIVEKFLMKNLKRFDTIKEDNN